jgi:hypothetical protein
MPSDSLRILARIFADDVLYCTVVICLDEKNENVDEFLGA